MNPQEMRREAHELLAEGEELLRANRTRSLSPREESRMEWVSTRAQQLIDDAESAERREGFVEVARPMSARYYPAHGSTRDNLTALEARYIRTGDPGVLAELRVSNATDMNIGTPQDGGYAVPTGHFQDIVAKLRPKALYAQLGLLDVPGRGTTVNVPIDNSANDGAFVATSEGGTFDLDAPALGQQPMTLVTWTKQVVFSIQLLNDEDSKLMDFVNTYISDGMAATLNSLLVTEVLSSGTAAVTAASPTTIAATDVPKLLYSLKSEYVGENTWWLMNRTTEGAIRGLSGNAFQFAPTPAGRTGPSSELFGVPVATSSYMPVPAASAKTVVIGNFSKMGIRLAPSLRILNDPYTLGHLGQVRLLCFFMADIEVLISEAFKYLTMST